MKSRSVLPEQPVTRVHEEISRNVWLSTRLSSACKVQWAMIGSIKRGDLRYIDCTINFEHHMSGTRICKHLVAALRCCWDQRPRSCLALFKNRDEIRLNQSNEMGILCLLKWCTEFSRIIKNSILPMSKTREGFKHFFGCDPLRYWCYIGQRNCLLKKIVFGTAEAAFVD